MIMKIMPGRTRPRTATTSLDEARTRYLEYRATLGSTTQGLYATSRYTEDFVGWCHDRRVTVVQALTPELVADYPRWLYHYRQKNGRPLSVNSRLAKLVPLRGWLKWLARAHKSSAELLDALELPKSVCSLPRHLPTLQDVEAILASPSVDKPEGLRDRAMMELLFATGIRRMEIKGLQVDDVDLARRQVLIRSGKGQKDRMLPMGERAAFWVERYLRHARPTLSRNSAVLALFLGSHGRPLSLNWTSTIVAMHIRAALNGRPGSCHLLRHAVATMMLESGADIRYIQQLLGHAQLVTTQIYTQVAIGQLQRVHSQCHPWARSGTAD